MNVFATRLALALAAGLGLASGSANCGDNQACEGESCPAELCGNGACDAGECASCAGDCQPSECESCGDGVCSPELEDCASCEKDCGACMECGSTTVSAPQPAAQHPDCEFLNGNYCLFPFPTNYFLHPDPTSPTGLRAKTPAAGLPRNNAGVPIQIEDLDRADGFSPVGPLVLRLPSVDLEGSSAPTITKMQRSLDKDSPILVIDAETGERQLVWAEYDAQAKNPDTQVTFIRPGAAYKEGRRYIAVLRNLRDFNGGRAETSDAFRAYRDCQPTENPIVEARRERMEALFGELAAFGVKRSELYLAWDFSIASAHNNMGRLVHMRNESFKELPGNTVPPFTIKDVEEEPPAFPFIARIIKGNYVVPNYLRLSPIPAAGGRLVLDSNGLPTRQFPDYTATFTCIVPKSSTSEGKGITGRGVIYGHQVLQTQEQILNSNVQKLAAEQNMTLCSIDLLGLSEGDALTIGAVLLDGSFFPGISDRAQQGVLNLLYLNRLMVSPTGFTSQAPFLIGANLAPAYDNKEIFYFGENYGVTMGGMFMALTKETKRGVLSVGGVGFGTILSRSQDFEPYRGILESSYPSEIDRAIIFATIQIVWDRAEASGYAQHLVRDMVDAETPPKKILIHQAFADHVVPNIATEQYARILGAKVYSPTLERGRSLDTKPLFGIDPMPGTPFDGEAALVLWDNGSTPAPPMNVAPFEGIDPHGAPGETLAARRQIGEFLKADGKVTDVCGGAPCLTD